MEKRAEEYLEGSQQARLQLRNIRLTEEQFRTRSDMTPAVELEILDLRHFSAGNLSALLDAEGRIWNDRLRWDFRASANLLLQYLDSRLLPGYVAMENGRIRGYSFCVYEADKAVLGDVFAVESRQGSQTAVEVERRLLERLVEMLQHSPGVERIESQLLLHSHGTHTEVLSRAGFQVYPRLFMELDLGLESPQQNPPAGGAARGEEETAGVEIRSWKDSDFSAASRLISQCYQGHLDSLINDQYRTVAGSQRFLHNIVRFPGCGIFDPAASRVLVDPAHSDLAGLLLCSRVRDDVAHVTQLCITRRFRKHGLGGTMLAQCARELKDRGLRYLTLTVTEENTSAVSLYRSRGFTVRHQFDAMVWDTRQQHQD